MIQILDEIRKITKNYIFENQFLLSEIEDLSPALQKTQVKTKPELKKTKEFSDQTTVPLAPKGKDFIEPVEAKKAELNALIVQALVELNAGQGQMQNLVEKFSLIVLRQLKGTAQLDELEVVVKKSMQLALTQILKILRQETKK